jgi:hypothetical protein
VVQLLKAITKNARGRIEDFMANGLIGLKMKLLLLCDLKIAQRFQAQRFCHRQNLLRCLLLIKIKSSKEIRFK